MELLKQSLGLLSIDELLQLFRWWSSCLNRPVSCLHITTDQDEKQVESPKKEKKGIEDEDKQKIYRHSEILRRHKVSLVCWYDYERTWLNVDCGYGIIAKHHHVNLKNKKYWRQDKHRLKWSDLLDMHLVGSFLNRLEQLFFVS